MKPLRGIITVFVLAAYLLILAVYPFETSSDFTARLGQFWASFLRTFPTSTDQLAVSYLIKKSLLFIPFGFLLYYLLKSSKTTRATTIVLACACGILLSFFGELCQTLFAGRHASAIDILGKTTGSICGTFIAGCCPSGVAKRVEQVGWHVERSKVPLLLALMWAVFPA